MRYKIITIVLSVLLVALGVAYFFLRSVHFGLKDEFDELSVAYNNLQLDHQSSSGGAEVPISVNPEWRFPLAEDDFLAFTSPYGYRVSPLLNVEMDHAGLDIAGVWKAQVVAVADGVVEEHWVPPDGYWRGHEIYGGMIRIRHDNGFSSIYAHLSWSRVHQGYRVQEGEVIGRVGNTGKSDGPHLHFEVRNAADEPMNPLLYIQVPD